jgi:hypothetical protein
MSAERTEALEVLREIWRVQGQAEPDLDDGCETKTCKRMSDAGVGFDEFGEAWRDRLKREGKYNEAGGTLRDLIMDPRS